mmetsp:Transcript_74340/g.147217  ORF Transcript_74340/g.147217 Transcript_74340/m.147217 type:complete len:88 (+) Transcript_74340:3-266(+)
MGSFGSHHAELMAEMQTVAMTAATRALAGGPCGTRIAGHVACSLTEEGTNREVLGQERESSCAVGQPVLPLDPPPTNPGQWRLIMRH